MSKVLEMLRRGKKQAMLVAIVAAAIIVPASLYAWGPVRTTYTVENPADHITFNSITNNPNIGDERNFVGIREATAPNVWHDEMKVEQGKEYVVRMYVHNNAADNLNLVAENTTARITLPTTTGRSVQVDGSVSASNATPQMVYDHATFTGDEDFNIAYIPGTLKYENNKLNTALPESIFTSAGALLGYDKLDGKVPGCFEYAGYVSFKVKPQFAEAPKDFTVEKQVRKEGATDGFKESTAVNPGDTVDYRIEVKNTGGTQLNNVALKDTLPTGVSFVPGTVKILNANNPGGAHVENGDNLVTSGINIGHYTPGSNAFVVFKAKVADNNQLPVCGENKLTNKASAQPEGHNPKEDTADVTVPKECQPEPEYKCTALAVNKLSDTKFKFETGYTVTGGTFKSVSYTIRNEAGQVVDTVAGTPNAVEYTQTTPGNYSVQATVTFTVNGQDVTATGEACKKSFKVPTPPAPKEIEVCDLESKKVITIKEEDFDPSKHSKNLEDCKEKPTEEYCPIPGKEHLPKDDPACKETPVTPEEKCPIPGKEHLPKDSADCRDNCPIPGMEHLPANSAECEEPVVAPSELPQTGNASGVLTLAGLASLALALGYAVTARRTLG